MIEFIPLIWRLLLVAAISWAGLYFMERKFHVPSKILYAFPLVLTLAMLLWTACVYKYSTYGDDWAILPVVAIAPVIFFWHIGLLWIRRKSIHFVNLLLYFLLHASVFSFLWFLCLHWISKDSI